MTDSSVLIIVAEDDKALNMVHRTMLEDEGIRMKIVENGAEVIKTVDEEHPAVLLLDLLMPQMDGFAVLKELQKKAVKFPIVVLTNLSSENDRRECMNLGASEVYVKSETDIEQLKQIIRKYAGKK